MNVFDAEGGSWAKPSTACCAATNALVTLMTTSRLNASSGRLNGSCGGVSVEALTVDNSFSRGFFRRGEGLGGFFQVPWSHRCRPRRSGCQTSS